MRFLSLILLVAVCCVGCGSEDQADSAESLETKPTVIKLKPITKDVKPVTIYYKPFNLATMGPVTPAEIEQAADCVLVLHPEDEYAKRIQGIIDRAGSGEFDDLLVRAKIVGMWPYEVYISQEGGILREGLGKSEFKLSPDSVNAIDRMVFELAKLQNCDSSMLWRMDERGYQGINLQEWEEAPEGRF